MTGSTPPVLPDPAGLRECLRDLVGLLALPDLWSNADPLSTLRLLAETVTEVLSLDACYVSASFQPQQSLSVLQLAGGPADLPIDAGWEPFMNAMPEARQELSVSSQQTPAGTLRTACFSLGYFGQPGLVVVGSRRQEFPLPTDLILLRSASSLAASGLRTARLVQERERLALEREKALRAKDEFLAMLGHELRNPLAPIVTALDLLKMKGGGTVSRELTIIERQVRHLVGLVDDLMDVTRIATGKVQIKRERIELAAAVKAAVETTRPLFEQRRHQLEVDVAETGLPVNADPRRLTQVFANLLVNAAKYSDPGGLIQVVGGREGADVMLTVRDNGTGIDPEMIDRVFDLFEQGAVSTDRAGGGVGVGLAVVKSLVALHGGSVAVDSEGRGQGSSFCVRLPLAGEAPLPGAADPGPVSRAAGTNRRVLVVDDNRDAADLTGDMLRSAGHEVQVCYNPVQALTLFDSFRPAVVILDIGLPVMDGYELARLLRGKRAAGPVRIVALSGYGQSTDIERGVEAGIDAHLTKPASLNQLLAALDP